MAIEPLREKYDWIVIGDSPGALLSGALVARLGLSALIVPTARTLAPKISNTGDVLDGESRYLAEFSAGGAWSVLLDLLGLTPAEKAKWFREGDATQILSPEFRLKLNADVSDWKSAVEQEFGAHRSGVYSLLAPSIQAGPQIQKSWRALSERLTVIPDVSGGTLFQRAERSWKNLVKAQGASVLPEALIRWNDAATRSERAPLGRSLSEGLWSLTAHTHPAELSRTLGKRWGMLAAELTTHARLTGGLTTLRSLLLKLAAARGAHVVSQDVCRQIFTHQGRFSGVQVGRHGQMVGARAGVLGISTDEASSLLSAGSLQSPANLYGWLMTVALRVRADGIPDRLESRAVFADGGQRPILFELASPEEYGLKSQDKGLKVNSDDRILFVRTVVPMSEGLDSQVSRMIASRMLDQVGRLFPSIEHHVQSVYPRIWPSTWTHKKGENGTESEWAEVYPWAEVREIPDALRVYAGKGAGLKTKIPGLFCGAGEAFPEWGTLGWLQSGLESTAWIAHRSGLAGPV